MGEPSARVGEATARKNDVYVIFAVKRDGGKNLVWVDVKHLRFSEIFEDTERKRLLFAAPSSISTVGGSVLLLFGIFGIFELVTNASSLPAGGVSRLCGPGAAVHG
jgi:hypothetical protein